MLSTLLPDLLDPGVAMLLVVASFFTSAITATLGLGGGLTMLALMGLFLPVSILIPVHGLVQLGSNGGRAWVLRDNICWRPLLPFFAFGAVGAILAAMLVVELPEAFLKSILGLFVISIVWLKVPGIVTTAPWLMAIGGFVTSALTMFLGATGPLVIALFSHRFGIKETLVASAAAAMLFQHAIKVLAFGLLGFAFASWLPLIAAMIVSGYLGTLSGVRLLKWLPEESFRFWFKIVITLLGADMIRRGLLAT